LALDAKGGADKGAGQFGYQLLGCVGLIAEPPGEIAVQATLVARPVAKLMIGGSVVAGGVGEVLREGQGDEIGMRSVIGLVATMPDIGAGRGNEGLRPLDARGLGKRLRGRGDLLGKPVDL